MELPQIRGQTARQTSGKEREESRPKNPRDRSWNEHGKAGRPDSVSQPDHQGMGKLSFEPSQQRNFSRDRSFDLARTLEVGTKATSKEKSDMDQKPIFPATRTPGLDIWSQEKTENGDEVYKLALHANTPIRKHVKVKAETNPFDPTWEAYFEEREILLTRKALFGRIKTLWERQEGICPNCQQRVTINQEWVVHHKTPKILGGGDTLDNLQLLHGNCHRQLHTNHTLDQLPVLQ